MSIPLKTKPKIVVILGPTASGKSDLAVNLAKHFKGEVVSADSRQVYKSLDIGSGKVTKKEMRGVPHYCLDIASPKRVFTVSQYQRLGQKAVKKISKNNHLPIICGGTGLYIDALIYNTHFPAVKPDKKLRTELEKKSTNELFAMLLKLDKNRAETIDAKNPRRLIRALEIVLATGKPVPEITKESPYQTLKIGIKRDDTELKNLIHKRLLKRLKIGMLKEVKDLLTNGVSHKRLEDLGLEYRYTSRFLQGKISKEEMMHELTSEINKYAKRQMTWFKKDKSIHWVKNQTEAEILIEKFLNS